MKDQVEPETMSPKLALLSREYELAYQSLMSNDTRLMQVVSVAISALGLLTGLIVDAQSPSSTITTNPLRYAPTEIYWIIPFAFIAFLLCIYS